MTSVRLAAVSLALVLIGCGSRTASTVPRTVSPTPEEVGRVTVHVRDMTKRLNIA
jgi:hypothetical protein